MAVVLPLAACSRPVETRNDAVGTRTLAWPGGDRLFVGLSADVRYVQGQTAKVVVTGPSDEIEDIAVIDGVIRHDRDRWGWDWWAPWRWPRGRGWSWRPDVQIVVTAPAISEAGVSGSGHLDLGRLAQDRLALEVSGSGAIDVAGQIKSLEVSISGSGSAQLDQVNVGDLSADLSGSGLIKASGAASTLHLGISGSGAADMGELTVQDLDAHLSGSGSARLSPKQSAEVGVSGSGSVHLLTEPQHLSVHRSGSGAIVHPGGSVD
jgi:hypothetical protein